MQSLVEVKPFSTVSYCNRKYLAVHQDGNTLTLSDPERNLTFKCEVDSIYLKILNHDPPPTETKPKKKSKKEKRTW